MSLRPSILLLAPEPCSGLMYAGVPITMPVCVLPVEMPASSVTRAMPKSTTFTKFFFPFIVIR
jgi:hypothetical protein